MKTFYDRFWEVSKEKGFATPTEAGEAIGFPSATVSLWKTRGSVPRQSTLDKVANYFNVSPDWLAGKPVDRDGKSLISGNGNESGVLYTKGEQLIGKMQDGSVGFYVPRIGYIDVKEQADAERVVFNLQDFADRTLVLALYGEEQPVTNEDLEDIREYARLVLMRRKRKIETT